MDHAANDLERRRQVRLRRRPDVVVQAQTYRGRTRHVVKDPVSLRYYRLREREHFLLGLMDGRHTLADACREFERTFPPRRLRLEEAEAFAQHLLQANLCLNETGPAGQPLFERHRQHQRARRAAKAANLLAVKVPLFDPDRLLGWMLSLFRWVFTPAFAAAGGTLIVAALLLVASHFDTFQAKLPSARQFFTWETAAGLWLALGAVKVVHEFGHGLSCKAFGGEVHEMGLLFLCFCPSLYCNVSDAWALPSKWRRIAISFAGVYVELLIAAAATFVWWHTAGSPFVNQLCLNLMVVCGINTVVLNGNPLLRYDGYYVLSDWLEVPNLRERADRSWKKWVLGRLLGLATTPEPSAGRWSGFLLWAYASASGLYRWVLALGILWFQYRFLTSHGLGGVGLVVAAVAAGGRLVRPVASGVRYFSRGGRLTPMRPRRLVMTGILFAVIVVFVGLVPLPVSRVRQTALVRQAPDAQEMLFVPVPAVLHRLEVRDGQPVEKGAVLAEFRSEDLETQREMARAEHEISGVRAHGPNASDEDGTSRPTAEEERDLLARRLGVYDRLARGLVIRAPRAGKVMGLPSPEEVGRVWLPHDETPFCTVGEPGRLQALLPVSPGDYRLLQEELANTGSLSATVRLPGMSGRTLEGRIRRLPESEAKDIPFSLAAPGGGPLPAVAGSQPETWVPASPVYLVVVELPAGDGSLFPGTLVPVKVPCRWRSCAWWLWRTVSAAFDLGLG